MTLSATTVPLEVGGRASERNRADLEGADEREDRNVQEHHRKEEFDQREAVLVAGAGKPPSVAIDGLLLRAFLSHWIERCARLVM